MSRSYRKPWYVQGYGTKRKVYFKNQANRRVRRAKNVTDGKLYKKFYDQYEICDWKMLWTPAINFCDPEWKAKMK